MNDIYQYKVYMMLNHLMAKLQPCNFGECRLQNVDWNYSQVLSVVLPVRVPSMG